MSVSPVVNVKFSNNTGYFVDNKRQVNRSPYFTAGSDEVYIRNKKKNSGSAAKWVLGLLIAGTLAGAGYLVFRKPGKLKLNTEQQNALNELVSQGKLQEKDVKIMQKIYKKDNPGFIGYAMHELLEDMGYNKSIHPRLIIANNTTGCNSWSPMKGITFSAKRLGKGSDKGLDVVKADLYGSMRHELEHFRQSEMIYRAFGKDGLVDAEINKILFNCKTSEDFCKRVFNKPYDKLTKTELKDFIAGKKADIGERIDIKLFGKIEKSLGKIKKGTAEYREAEAYLNASKEYASVSHYINGKSLTEIQQLPQETKDFLNKYYFENLLEKNAYKEGDAAEEKFKLFAEAVGR